MKLRFLSICMLFSALSTTMVAQADESTVNNQPKDFSLFSRYGIGNILPQTSIAGGSMGGLTAAFRDPFIANIQNPASLAALRATTYEFGLYGKNTSIEDAKNKSNGWAGNINNVGLAFPTYSVINEFYDRKPRQLRYSMGLYLTPFSNVGYDILTEGKTTNTDSVIVSNRYTGNGGTYQAFWGHGVSYKKLSMGVNLGYMFGKMNNTRKADLSSNLIVPYTTNFEDFYTLRGLTYTIGAQYDFVLDPNTKEPEKGNKKHLVLGAYIKPSTNFTTNAGTFYRREGVFVDTISISNDISGKGKLPTELTAGFAYESGSTLRVGAEFMTARWSQYKNDARVETLKDITQIGIGAEFVLNRSKMVLEEDKMRWRVGFRTGTDPRVLQGEQLKMQTISVGFTKVMRASRKDVASYMSVGLAYDKLGTTKIKENAYRLTLGFSLNDNSWFLKRRFQ